MPGNKVEREASDDVDFVLVVDDSSANYGYWYWTVSRAVTRVTM